jgi:hypothetical protein
MATTMGLLLLADNDSKPSPPAVPPQQWPGGVSRVRDSSKPIVMMFLHPHCPCSRASLSELARLAHDERGQLEFCVLFTQPSGVAASWSQTALWENAVANSNLHVVIDHACLLAKQFGAKTSGQVLVYDREGTLRFEGGITPGRGHSGDTVGRSAIRAIAASQTAGIPVNCATFGCSLSATLIPTNLGSSP